MQFESFQRYSRQSQSHGTNDHNGLFLLASLSQPAEAFSTRSSWQTLVRLQNSSSAVGRGYWQGSSFTSEGPFSLHCAGIEGSDRLTRERAWLKELRRMHKPGGSRIIARRF